MKISEFISKYNIIYILTIGFLIYNIRLSHLNIYDIDLQIKNDPENKKLYNKKNFEIFNLAISYIFVLITLGSMIYFSIYNQGDLLLQLYNIVYILPIYFILVSVNYTIYSFNYFSIFICVVMSLLLVWLIRESFMKKDYQYSLERLNKIPQPPRNVENI